LPNQPDVGDVHANALLTQISIAHIQQPNAFVADKVFPLVGVDKQSDIYLKYTRGDFMVDPGEQMTRAPNTRAALVGYGVDKTNTYYCRNQAIGMEISDELRGNADAVFQLDQEVTTLLSQIHLIRRERLLAAAAFAGSQWLGGTGGTDVDVTDGSHGGARWQDYGASDPIGDIELEKDTVELASGVLCNKLIMGAIVWRRLKHHPDFIDLIKYGAAAANPAMITPNLLAQILELDEVLVSRAIYKTSVEGVTLTLGRVIDDDALLCYVPTAPGLLVPAAGYTFFWRPLTGGAIQFARKGRQERERYDWIEVHSYLTHVLTEAYAGAFFADCVN